MVGLKQQLSALNHTFASFFHFLGSKLKNFKNLALGEQISYSSIIIGLILIIASIVLFIV